MDKKRMTLEWIPVKWIEEKRATIPVVLIADCAMPEDNQEILISHNGYVTADICLIDSDGYYLDSSGYDWSEVDAWMPMPEPYREVEENE